MAEEKGKPLTREDVLRLIEENGGKAVGLDLSNRKFQDKVDLSDLDLSGIILNNAQLFRANFNGSKLDGSAIRGANLQYATFNPFESKVASLQAADLRNAHLENAEFREADLSAALFEGEAGRLLPASLDNTDFRGATLFLTNFKGCYFYGTKLEGAFIRGADIFNAHLEEADWGSYVIGEENKKDFYSAEHYYRQLKMWYTKSGYYDIAGEFFFREMTVKRKALKWWPNPVPGAWSKFISLICGYGERPFRVIGWAASVVFGLALIYFGIGTLTPSTFLDCLYYSAASFTALGYGSWVKEATGWVKGLGVFESFIGVLTIALFLVTFTRKMTR